MHQHGHVFRVGQGSFEEKDHRGLRCGLRRGLRRGLRTNHRLRSNRTLFSVRYNHVEVLVTQGHCCYWVRADCGDRPISFGVVITKGVRWPLGQSIIFFGSVCEWVYL